MTHRTEPRDSQTVTSGRSGPVKAIWKWFAETHREVQSAQSFIENKHHRL